MKVLVINCGSSSLKFQLMDMETESVEAKGLCERIGSDGSRIVYTPVKKPEFGKITIERPMPTHKEAIQLVIDCLTDDDHGVVSALSEIDAVGHRVVHGGEKYVDSVLIDYEVIKAFQE